jgi:hypothetical protein
MVESDLKAARGIRNGPFRDQIRRHRGDDRDTAERAATVRVDCPYECVRHRPRPLLGASRATARSNANHDADLVPISRPPLVLHTITAEGFPVEYSRDT